MASDDERPSFGGDQHNSAAAGDQELPADEPNRQYQATGFVAQYEHPGGEQGQIQQRKPEDEDEVIYYYRAKKTITSTIGDPGLGGGGTGLDYLGGTGGGRLATGTNYLGGTGGSSGGGH